jgi:KaiC/GvpD/RAD55 family RecA-like ATPase
MYRKEVSQKSPLRILERSIHGGLGRGNLGVVMARAGLGKTAFLIQVALDEALRDHSVLHLALGQSLEHTLGWYDTLFDDLVHHGRIESSYEARATVGRRRIIQALPDRRLTADRLEQVISLYGGAIAYRPAVIVIDGFAWEGPAAECRTALTGFKAIAKKLDAELWLSVQTHREQTTDAPKGLTPPCASCDDLIDVAVFLAPQGSHVNIRLLKDHDNPTPADTELELDPVLLRIIGDEERQAARLPARAFMLLSSGSAGVESEIGAAAEHWGVSERNFSYAGRKDVARPVALVDLDAEALGEGAVSLAYAESHLGRKLAHTEEMRRTLQLIWHMVVTAEQIFVIDDLEGERIAGERGGWAMELARRFKKPLCLFDQKSSRWMSWGEGAWIETDAPKITRQKFSGTGSQLLTAAGRDAIWKLFGESFGPLV